MSRFFWVCVGGAAGTGARYLISGWALTALGTSFPWGTLAVNVIGSFAIGAVMQMSLTTQLIPPMLRLALTTGVLGGFTTYSAFNYETLRYLQEGARLYALASIVLMLLGCLAAGAAGIWAARLLTGY